MLGKKIMRMGKYEWKLQVNQTNQYFCIGVCKADLMQLAQYPSSYNHYWYVVSTGGGYGGGSSISWSGFSAGDVVTIAVDVDAGSVTFSKNDEAGVSCSNLVGPVCLMVNTYYSVDGCTILNAEERGVTEVDEAGRVTKLVLSGCGLRGGIPSSIGQLSALRELRLGRNELEGEVPETIGDLSVLEELRLEANQLVGSIPARVGQAKMLRRMDLDRNGLEGGVAVSLGNLLNLQYLNLSSNEGLTSPDGTPGKLSLIHI